MLHVITAIRFSNPKKSSEHRTEPLLAASLLKTLAFGAPCLVSARNENRKITIFLFVESGWICKVVHGE